MYRTGDLLVRAGLVSFPALAEALAACTAGSFTRLATQWHKAARDNEGLLCQALAAALAPHPVVITSESTFDITLLDQVSKSHARQELFLPVQLEAGQLSVLVTEPEHASRIFLPESLRKQELRSYIVVDSILRNVIDEAYQAREHGASLWIGAQSQSVQSPHLVQSETPQAPPSDLDSLLGAFVATVAEVEVPAAPQSPQANPQTKRVLARIALEKRRARDVPSE